jgi:hypothetical protein
MVRPVPGYLRLNYHYTADAMVGRLYLKITEPPFGMIPIGQIHLAREHANHLLDTLTTDVRTSPSGQKLEIVFEGEVR